MVFKKLDDTIEQQKKLFIIFIIVNIIVFVRRYQLFLVIIFRMMV